MKLELPGSWEDITIKQFSDITNAKENINDDLELMIEILSILSGVERQKLDQLDLVNLSKCYRALSFLDQFKVKEEPTARFEIDGVHYFADFKITNLTAGQYIDLKHFTKDPKLTIANMHNVLAVFYIPVGKKYGEVSGVANIFHERLSITVAYPAAVFFWNLLKVWMDSLNIYSKDKNGKKRKKVVDQVSRALQSR